MNTNELRLGNLVNVPNKDQSPFRIDGFEYWGKEDGKVEMQTIPNTHPLTWWIKDLTPIVMTIEWLESHGFKLDEDKGFRGEDDSRCEVFSSNGFDIALVDGKFRLWIEIDGDTWYNFWMSTIDYVHQLQNLYFALKGVELQLSST